MDMGQGIRRIGLGARRTGSWLTSKLLSKLRWRPRNFKGFKSLNRRSAGRIIGGGIALIVLYYLLGAFIFNTVDANLDFRPEQAAQPGESAAVAMVVALIDREVRDHGWRANDPIFKPTVILDNMPNFQQGIIAALARFSFELTDQLGRTRGSSQADPDLQEASGLLQYAGDKWIWDPSVSLLPTATSEQQYRKAAKALRNYNNRLTAGTAVFERRSDNLLATLDRIALDIGSSSAVIDAHISEKSGFPIHRKADDVFYTVKGQTYGYYMILSALGEDFAEVLAERKLQKPYAEMLRSFELASVQEPIFVINGSPDSLMIPCHLCGQGFYLLRARTQLREITNILLK
jgi:hypothetical protein